MAFALLDENDRIIDVVVKRPRGKKQKIVELSEEDLDSINRDKKGHCSFCIRGGELVRQEPEPHAGPVSSPAADDVGAPVYAGADNPHEVGFFGNIWIRKLFFPTKDTEYQGHKHDHDHVSLLLSGSVLVEVAGYPSKEFKAPTYIVIRAEHEHKITALEDRTLWWCLHAMRDDDGEVIEVYNNNNDPLAVEVKTDSTGE